MRLAITHTVHKPNWTASECTFSKQAEWATPERGTQWSQQLNEPEFGGQMCPGAVRIT